MTYEYHVITADRWPPAEQLTEYGNTLANQDEGDWRVLQMIQRHGPTVQTGGEILIYFIREKKETSP